MREMVVMVVLLRQEESRKEEEEQLEGEEGEQRWNLPERGQGLGCMLLSEQ